MAVCEEELKEWLKMLVCWSEVWGFVLEGAGLGGIGLGLEIEREEFRDSEDLLESGGM